MDIDGIRPVRGRNIQRSIDGMRPSGIRPAQAPRPAPRPAAQPHRSVFAAPPRPEHTAGVQPAAQPARGRAFGSSAVQPSGPAARKTGVVPAAAPRPVPPGLSDRPSGSHKQLTAPRYHAPDRPKQLVRKRRWSLHGRWSVRRIVWSSVATLVVLVLGVGGFLSWRAYANLHKVFRGTSTATVLSKKVTVPADLKTEGDARVNILLLGVGGPGHQGPDLTDTIVILSVDPVNGSAVMLSVPRDLWVKQPVNYFGAEQKINAAYESGKYKTLGHLDGSNSNSAAVEAGFDSIDTVIKTVFNVNIHYHMLVNFQAFKQAVDTVGGITVDVPERLYDPTMAWENHWNPVLAPAGVQQMDGVKALLYARSRETTSDFARSQRQRQILLALKDKVLDLGTLSNPAKIEGLMNAFGNNVYSDMSTSDATKLYGIMKKIDDKAVASIGLTDESHKLVTTARINNTSAVQPLAGLFQYGPIQEYARSQLVDGYIAKENAAITVAAPTEAAGAATTKLLKSYGYNVTATVVTTEPVAQTAVIDLSKTKAPYTVHYLQARFGVKATTSLPAGVSVALGSAKFVIMVSK